MKSIIATSLALSLLGAGFAVAQDPSGLDPSGLDPSGLDPSGLDPSGLDPSGTLPIEGQVGQAQLAAVPPHDNAPSPPPAADSATPAPTNARGNPLWSIPLDQLRATRERPVFSESRRPPVVAVVAPPRPVAPPQEPEPVEPEPPALTLVGTVVGADEAIAVFLDSSAREVMRLRIGEEGSGWTLRSIDPKSTVFEKDSREVTLSLPAPETGSGADSAEEAGTFVQAPFPPPSVNFPPPRARPPGPPPNGRPPGLGARRARPPAGNEF